ncbi:MAG: beta-lactamase family protein [Anaerolineae bacterium]|jgi:CubicO group peptidase (beta-lactamase class C family)|nr:beta-lactamase family protein [Anaerolineae bacterium]
MSHSAFSRRNFLKLAGLATAGVALPLIQSETHAAPQWQLTGAGNRAMRVIDNAIMTFMQARGLIEASASVSYQGRLVLARGYTFAAVGARLVQPTTLFRIASISKPITAAAVARLIDEGRLQWGSRLTQLVNLQPLDGQTMDPRLNDVTVNHLMAHRGGWNRNTTFDPMFYDQVIAQANGVGFPIANDHIKRYMTGRTLDFTPGSATVYSNYGYSLLGDVIAAASGTHYRRYVTQNILAPAGIRRTLQGRSLRANRQVGEVRRYRSIHTSTSVVDPSNAVVPFPYGGFNLENMLAHGGWVSTSVDLTRFAHVYENPWLRPSDWRVSNPLSTIPTEIDSTSGDFTGAMRLAAPSDTRNTWAWSFYGSLPGTFTLTERRADGICFTVLFNQRSEGGNLEFDSIRTVVNNAINSITTWPVGDLFPTYL